MMADPTPPVRFEVALNGCSSSPAYGAGAALAAEATERLVRVQDLFEVLAGTSLELNSLTQVEGGVPFVARSAKNNGVTAFVTAPPGIVPIPAGVLSVARGGTPMSTFLQEEPFYCGRDVSYLVPKMPMSRAQLLYYAACLRANRYRFSFGRQANRSLATLKLPGLQAVPGWVEQSIPQMISQLRTRLKAGAGTTFADVLTSNQ